MFLAWRFKVSTLPGTNVSQATVSGNQLTCPLYTGVFLGNALQLSFLHIDPKTANMSQFLQLGPLDFDPDLGYVSYFWGIDSANNHSHISKSHPLNNTDTLGGRFPWPVTLSKCNWFWNTPPIFIYDALFRGVGTLFSARFAINAVWK